MKRYTKRTACVLGVVVGLGLTAPAAQAVEGTRVVRFQAKAYDLNSGRYLYSEHHAEHWRGDRHIFSEVHYKRGSRTLVFKRITFQGSRVAPDYRMKDYRSGYEEGLVKLGAGKVRMVARRSSKKALEEKVVPLPRPAVVDGGFDYFVRLNWSELVSGRTLYVNFAVPIELDYFKFKIRKTGDATVNGRPAHRFEFSIASRFLAMFAESIQVDYDKANRRLLQYRGISNINDQEGKSHRTRIIFDYGSAARPGE